MKTTSIALIASLGLTASAVADVFPGASWATKTPAEVGLDESELQALAAAAGGNGMIVRDGYQVFTWGDPASGGDWASASKATLSTLLLFAEAQGLCTVNTPMGTYLSGSPKDEAITFLLLANMLSGYSRGEGPGQAWAYNDHAINLYGKVLYEHVFGNNAPTVFDQQFGFLNFEDSYNISDWQYGRVKNMSVRDFARFGLFWLNRGTWDGVEVIPSVHFNWISNPVPAGVPITSSDGPESWSFGTYGGGDNQTSSGPGTYAMNFWTNQYGTRWPGFPHDIYHANGHFNQKVCWVIPSLNMVVTGFGTNVMFGETDALQHLFDADLTSVSSGSGLETQSWTRTKALYR